MTQPCKICFLRIMAPCAHTQTTAKPSRTIGEMTKTLKPSSASMPTTTPAVPGLLVQLKATEPTAVPEPRLQTAQFGTTASKTCW